MKTPHKIAISLFIMIVTAVATVFVVREHTYVNSSGDPAYSNEFADMQAKHLNAAKRCGVAAAPFKDSNEAGKCADLFPIHSDKTIKVSKMKYGLPYLTGAAKNALMRIAADFQSECREKSLPQARLIVTSMLRTEADVQGLRKQNLNAVAHSAHMYGTTFDIAWSGYQCYDRKADGDMYLIILADVLRKQRKQGCIYVRYEVAQRCFHITAVK